MEVADLKYRESLSVMEGIARVEVDDQIIDLEMITQARNSQMAARNFSNEIMEHYGFNAKLRHVFVEGKKFTPRTITEWSMK